MKTIFKLAAISAAAMTLVACGGGGGGGGGSVGQGSSDTQVSIIPGVGPASPVSRIDGSASADGGQLVVSNSRVSGSINGVSVSGYMNETVNISNPARASGYGSDGISLYISADNKSYSRYFNENFTWKHIATGQNQGVEITAEDGTKVLLPYAPNVQVSQVGSYSEDGVAVNLQSTTVLNTVGDPYQSGYLNARYGNGSNPISIGNAITTPLAISSSNADIQAAWNAGWRGQGVNVGFNSSNVTTVNNAFETMRTTVAPLVHSYNDRQFDVVTGFGSNFIAAPGPHWNTLKANGLYVASYANILTAKTANPTYTSANILAVTHQASVATLADGIVSYTVPTATSIDDASIKGAGMTALVMSKFNGLSGAQAGDVLQQTAVTNAGNGKTLSLQNALAPAGKLR